MISNFKRKSCLSMAFAIVLASGLASCRGFFVKPTLTSITVTPATPNLQIGQSLQMIATGNFNDGTTGGVSGVVWTSSSPTQVSVNSSTGLIKALANTTSGVTITATSGAVSGSTTVTVGQSSALTVTCSSCSGSTISLSANGGVGSTITFSATQGGTDVTSSATWTSSNTNAISTPADGRATLVGTTGVIVTITATTSSGSGSVQVTVNP